MSYEDERDDSDEGEPSLVDMTQAAIKMLSKNKDGYFLMVEGGMIDHAHHGARVSRSRMMPFFLQFRETHLIIPIASGPASIERGMDA